MSLRQHTPAMRQRLESIAEVLNLFPEVEWDRTAGSGKARVVFGWIPRADGRADFLLLTFEGDGRVGMTTSSAEHSLEFHRRLYSTTKGHGACQRVEHVFNDAGIEVTNVINLEGDS